MQVTAEHTFAMMDAFGTPKSMPSVLTLQLFATGCSRDQEGTGFGLLGVPAIPAAVGLGAAPGPPHCAPSPGHSFTLELCSMRLIVSGKMQLHVATLATSQGHFPVLSSVA